MDITLVVVRPFGPHAVGDRITQQEVIAAILATDLAHAVVAIANPSTSSEH